MVATPLETPTTMPEPGAIVAIVGSLLVHVPPVVVFPKVIENPMQTWVGPVMAFGKASTVTVDQILQFVPSV